MGSRKSSPTKAAATAATTNTSTITQTGNSTLKATGSERAGGADGKSQESSAQSTQTVNGVAPTTITCKHLPAVVEFLKMYHLVARSLRWSRELVPKCAECPYFSAPLYACLQCPQFWCWQAAENHLLAHNTDSGHALAVEVTSGVMYCCVCKVFVWTEHMRSVWEEVKSSSTCLSPYIARLEAAHTAEYCEGSDLQRHCVGVRGLFNLGNTCFMNSILQTMLHNIPLKRYFLAPDSPFHLPKTCARTRAGEICMTCEIDTLFCQMNSGAKSPFAPHRLLEAVWRNSKDMAGYEQQDAHEFFVTIRNALHLHLEGTMFNCQCIVHRIFSGVLQSDVTCIQCGHVTETFDPFLDISMDIPADSASLQLTDCIHRFTRSEKLQSGSYVCNSCHQNQQEIMKRLTFRSHPAILTIHLKRFEHGLASTKIDTSVLFTSSLDIAPYMTETPHPSEARNYQYHLFSVVSHVGSLDSGHYTSFVRHRNEWFWVDDGCVTACTETDVYKSSVYMLFYIREERICT